jgi:hypothetical protein
MPASLARKKASLVGGGPTRYLVDMLKEGLTGYILDGQTFDLEYGALDFQRPRYVPTSPKYNFHGKGNFRVNCRCLRIGRDRSGSEPQRQCGGEAFGRPPSAPHWRVQNCLFAGCTILALPSFRDRIPVIVDDLATITWPGELVDVVVTERGIAINPKRRDLLDAVKSKGLPIRTIEEVKAEVEQICGGRPAKPRSGDRPVAVVKWVDGNHSRYSLGSARRQQLCCEGGRRGIGFSFGVDKAAPREHRFFKVSEVEPPTPSPRRDGSGATILRINRHEFRSGTPDILCRRVLRAAGCFAEQFRIRACGENVGADLIADIGVRIDFDRVERRPLLLFFQHLLWQTVVHQDQRCRFDGKSSVGNRCSLCKGEWSRQHHRKHEKADHKAPLNGKC